MQGICLTYCIVAEIPEPNNLKTWTYKSKSFIPAGLSKKNVFFLWVNQRLKPVTFSISKHSNYSFPCVLHTCRGKLCRSLISHQYRIWKQAAAVEGQTNGLLFIANTQAEAQKWFIRGPDRQALIWIIATSKTQLFKVPAISPLLETGP